jgi:hypothetical protein
MRTRDASNVPPPRSYTTTTSRRAVSVFRCRWVYSNPAADGSWTMALTVKPAWRNASSVISRCAAKALAGTATTARNSGSWDTFRRKLERVRSASRTCERNWAMSSVSGMTLLPSATVCPGPASGPERRRLNERKDENDGSSATARASKPKRSSPPRSATTVGIHSRASPASSMKSTTGWFPRSAHATTVRVVPKSMPSRTRGSCHRAKKFGR